MPESSATTPDEPVEDAVLPGDTDEPDDDDSLLWAGDAERGRDSRASSLRGSDREDAAPAATAAIERPATRSDLVARIAFGAVALASAAGWIAVVLQNPVEQPSLLGIVMYQLGEFLAIIAAPLGWVVVDRTQRTERARLIGWAIAAVVTAPWPLAVGLFA